MRSFFISLAVMAGPALAEPFVNQSGVAIRLQVAPGPGQLTAGLLSPGALAEVGGCDAFGQWCLLTAGGLTGWVEASVLEAPEDPVAAEGVVPSAIEVMPLPAEGDAPEPGGGLSLQSQALPLPQAILDAVPEASEAPAVPEAYSGETAQPVLLAMSEPTFNVTTGDVNLRAGPGTETEVLRRLPAGAGAMIETCLPSEAWCRVAPLDGEGGGWVLMQLMGERRLTETDAAR